jgi:DNA-binding transcriptional ArsR family regulator
MRTTKTGRPDAPTKGSKTTTAGSDSGMPHAGGMHAEQWLADMAEADLETVLKALSHPLRRQILTWLKDPANEFPDQEHAHELGVCAGQIDARAGVSQSTVSVHLATLVRAGLITSTRFGQWHFFRRDDKAIAAFKQRIDALI